MNIVVSLTESSNLRYYYKTFVTHVLLNYEDFSSGVKCFDINEIAELTKNCHDNNLKVIVKMDELYDEKSLVDVSDALIHLDKIGVDGILMSDLTIKVLIDDNSLNLDSIYAPETLLTNYYDVEALKENGFSNIVISKDIPLVDSYEIAEKVKDYCYMRVHGPILISYSRRRFISSYLNEEQEHVYNYFLKEETRDNILPIIEKNDGTWIYGSTVQSIDNIKEIIKKPFAGIIIDNVFLNDDYTLQVMNIYAERIASSNAAENLLTKLREIDKNIEYTSINEIRKTELDKR